jgi:putative ABC transport system substrate-binding protein
MTSLAARTFRTDAIVMHQKDGRPESLTGCAGSTLRITAFGLVMTLTVGFLTAPLAAQAQGSGKVYRIGSLGFAPLTTPELRRRAGAFDEGLRELGYVEGKNLFTERRYYEGRVERARDLAAELVRLNVDLIVAWATPAAQAAQQATSKIPIVMVAVVDPVGAGLVASLARPGGNVTGPTMLSAELSGKRLELLKEAIPGASRVAVLWNPTNRSNVLQLEQSKVAAQVLRMGLQPLEVRGPQDLDGAFQAITRARADALTVLDDPAILLQRARILAFAAKSRLPAMYGIATVVDEGGLMKYGANTREHARQAAAYVDKILKGAKPADLPVQQPTKFELMINLKTAKALGLTLPQSLLLRADEVIQ